MPRNVLTTFIQFFLFFYFEIYISSFSNKHNTKMYTNVDNYFPVNTTTIVIVLFDILFVCKIHSL